MSDPTEAVARRMACQQRGVYDWHDMLPALRREYLRRAGELIAAYETAKVVAALKEQES